jgi:hypothetical protein
MAKSAKSMKDEFDLYAILCFSEELLLCKDALLKVIDDFSGFDGYIIWISDFDEKEIPSNYLTSLIDFVENLTAKGKPVYNLYGEYFSLILSKIGLSGYSRGLGFSEKKFVDACVSGGGQPKRFYSPLLHYSVSETAIMQFYSIFPKLLCNCDICKLIKSNLSISKNPSLNEIEKFFLHFDFIFDSKKHLVSSHAIEINDIVNSTLDEIIDRLNKEITFYDKNTLDLYGVRKNHLVKWLESLNEFKKR